VSERVSFHIDERGIARVQLIWVEGRNAIDPLMVEQLAAAIEGCRDASVRSVLISADGPAFTVGGDLRHFAAHTEDLGGALAAIVPAFHEALLALAALECPVVAVVHGAIAGGGLGLAWCSDVVLAADGTRFATGFSHLGLSGDGGSSWWLLRLVGLRRAQQLLIGGRVLDADEALDWGLVTEVVAPGELATRAEAVAADLAAGPTFAFARMRRLLLGAGARTLEEHLAAEAEAMLACGDTPDAVEGVTAFIERRPPDFRHPITSTDEPSRASND
jgi:2-(1,2-epoxy-1,2-dihydrophenyl)acetyl-CoA isomerase